MQFRVEKYSISNYPIPQVNCHLFLFLDNVNADNKENAIYSSNFSVSLSELVGLETSDEKDIYILQKGEELFNSEQIQSEIRAIEAGFDIELGLI